MQCLSQILLNYKKVAVAYSGGLDSTTLLALGKKVLGKNVVALMGVAPIFSVQEQMEGEQFCLEHGIELIKVPFEPMQISEFVANGENRCYYCKKSLFLSLQKVADERESVLVDGTNLDDDGDFRPGRKAAEELGVESPFYAAGMGKDAIRKSAKELNLDVWDKPSMACLASRIAKGMQIDIEILKKIDKAECQIRELGYRQIRCRVMGDDSFIVENESGEFSTENKEKISNILLTNFSSIKQVEYAKYITGAMNLR
ncbi:MAG: ATP-dependent sacrificial sulfur transferase LarE [Acidaminococcaceae bacterium]|nr:ATP-dependent sacrificial sulfur transferase LarE [Acidaminococcaceae bacterium]